MNMTYLPNVDTRFRSWLHLPSQDEPKCVINGFIINILIIIILWQ